MPRRDKPQISLPLGGPARPPAENAAPKAKLGSRERPQSVAAVVQAAGNLVESHFGSFWVEGEVSTLRTPASGHVYCVLKDGKAQLPMVMWRSAAQRLKFRLKEGERFRVRGRLGIFPDQGKFQLYGDHAEPAGLGDAALALEALKRKLAEEGLFAKERKRPLPPLPKLIGLVTSSTGAAIRDILQTVERRFPTPILVSPTRVQGEGAAKEIARAIAAIAKTEVDVVIVGRGGGSAEDLWVFNDEAVVRAIAACPMPVVSAVGHEIDITLADLVADVRAATPTAAGELVVPERRLCRRELENLQGRLLQLVRADIDRRRSGLERVEAALGDPTRLIDRRRQAVDELALRAERCAQRGTTAGRGTLAQLRERLVALHPRSRLHRDRAEFDALRTRLGHTMGAELSRRQQVLQQMAGRLDALSPLKVLARGYALVRTAKGEVLLRASDTKPGDKLHVKVSEGDFAVKVISDD